MNLPSAQLGSSSEQQLSTSRAASSAVKIEKNLASLGFFTPSSKRIRTARKKTVSFTRLVDGNRLEARATILPSAEYGLPITADQDKFLGLQKIITDLRNREGIVLNPIGFTSAELLRILGKRVTAGKNYEDIAEWLKRMTLTGISSEGTVYFAGRKIWASDTFHVFDRSVSVGSEMPDGSIAERNYVWLSQWQLENINSNHLLPVDLDSYRQLKNHIAKTLVPLLYVWLMSTREEGRFVKPYGELCQILNISHYRHLSKIQEKLAPSLNELQTCGYLAGWRMENPAGGYQIVFLHGEKFRPDAELKVPAAKGLSARMREEVMAALLARKVTPRRAKLLADTADANQPVLDQLEWGDLLMGRPFTGRRPEVYFCLVKENLLPPGGLDTNRKSRLRRAAGNSEVSSIPLPHGRGSETVSGANTRSPETAPPADARLALDYEAYVFESVESYLRARFTETGLRRRIELRRTGLEAKYPALKDLRIESLRELAYASIRSESLRKISILSRDEFAKRRQGLQATAG